MKNKKLQYKVESEKDYYNYVRKNINLIPPTFINIPKKIITDVGHLFETSLESNLIKYKKECTTIVKPNTRWDNLWGVFSSEFEVKKINIKLEFLLDFLGACWKVKSVFSTQGVKVELKYEDAQLLTSGEAKLKTKINSDIKRVLTQLGLGAKK